MIKEEPYIHRVSFCFRGEIKDYNEINPHSLSKEILMSNDATATQPKPERSLGAEVARTATISAAANAAGIMGVLGGLVLVSKLSKRMERNADSIETTTEPETAS